MLLEEVTPASRKCASSQFNGKAYSKQLHKTQAWEPEAQRGLEASCKLGCSWRTRGAG